MVYGSTTTKTIARELYGEVIVNKTIAGYRLLIISLIVLLRSWTGRVMIDCIMFVFIFIFRV